MAYAAVASLSHTINLVLSYHQHSISPQLNDAITSLHTHTVFLQQFFDDFQHETNRWEEIISEATTMAERIIEFLLADSVLESTIGSSRSKPEQGKYQLPYGFDELNRVTEEIQSIIGEIKGLKTMDGPYDELIEVISLLREEPSKLRFIALYEEEGLGNTFLARKAYSDPSVVEHFDIRAWATVSGKYHPPTVIRDLLRSMKIDSSSNSENELIQTLFEKLKGMRYLIVLGDVTDFNFIDFHKLIYQMLPNENNGSRIIVTTTSFTFLKFADCFIRVGFMYEYEDHAWNLIRKKIFKGDPFPSHLVSAGKMIARSCRWVPHCIGVISGILAAADQTEAAWEDISDNIKFATSSDYDNKESRILSLGYTYLPHHLRPCFLYLLMFNKYGVGVHVSKLIKLWVAEGFINESECKSFEEAGEDYVEELVRRNLILVSERKSNGRIKSVRIGYDMLWDLCLKQGHVDGFILRIDSLPLELNSCSHRHVSARIDGDFLKGVNGSTIRTIMSYMSDTQRDFRLSIGNVRLLRILDLSNAYHYDLPEEVFELFHLRYLAFHCGFSISEAISSLVNLQTLIVYPRESDFIIGNLAEGIWRMPQLRHLLFRFELPTPKGALEDLQTLSTVVDFVCLRENLKMIPNLKKLALLYTKRWNDYELHNLIYLRKLEILKIEMDCSFVEQQKIMSCAFPPTLKKLSLSNVRVGWDDMKSVALLPNLQVLKLRKLACIGKTWETSEGGFGQLTYLLIQESNLEHWIMEATHFPRLNSLVLHHCWYLNEVPSDMGKIPTLKYIYLDFDRDNKSLLCSAKWIRDDRKGLGYDPLFVSDSWRTDNEPRRSDRVRTESKKLSDNV